MAVLGGKRGMNGGGRLAAMTRKECYERVGEIEEELQRQRWSGNGGAKTEAGEEDERENMMRYWRKLVERAWRRIRSCFSSGRQQPRFHRMHAVSSEYIIPSLFVCLISERQMADYCGQSNEQ